MRQSLASTPSLPVAWIFLSVTAAMPARACAQSLAVLAGLTESDNHQTDTYAWQIEFQQQLTPLLSGSVSWLNEGHIPDHHRDGATAQLWLNSPAWHQRIVLSVGAGPYMYFDTESAASVRGFSDVHSVAALLSAAATVDLGAGWFARLNLNNVWAPADLGTYSVLLGGGYRFGPAHSALASSSPGQTGSEYPPQQIQLFAGQMILSDPSSRGGRTYGADYRFDLARWAAWSATWYYDPGSTSGRRDRAATQLWLVEPMAGDRLALSIGLGVYAEVGPQTRPTASSPNPVSGLSGLRAEWRLSRRSSLVLTWQRTFTNDDDDRDIIGLGYAFRFGAW
jgi:hypothetical protein